MSPVVTEAAALPTGEHYARNLIGGQWRFPAAPYEFEIRNPVDSTVTTVVPLSSRFDVARAVRAAGTVAGAWAAEPAERIRLLGLLVAELDRLAGPLAALQSVESGLALADSRVAVAAVVRATWELLNHTRRVGRPVPGVSGHVLSWGLPLAEAVCAIVPALRAGYPVVVKPSLRAPLSAVALGLLATRLGFPDGVVNVVQGTGLDAGAALLDTPGLAALQVRAGARTLAQAARSRSPRYV
ncbi:MAG TPA: aldehyde dehydrogenase family protein, partial [Rugosimonospora sp.]|nr:aldehyde dehydrogenase family protein [Rugosimonospora sp.]